MLSRSKFIKNYKKWISSGLIRIPIITSSRSRFRCKSVWVWSGYLSNTGVAGWKQGRILKFSANSIKIKGSQIKMETFGIGPQLGTPCDDFGTPSYNHGSPIVSETPFEISCIRSWLERRSIGPVLREERQDTAAVHQQPLREYHRQ